MTTLFWTGIIVIISILWMLLFWIITRFLRIQSHLELLEKTFGVKKQNRIYRKDFVWKTIRIGMVSWRRCVDIGIEKEGLYLCIHQLFYGDSVFLIPWKELRFSEKTRLYWRDAMLLRLVRVPDVSLTVFQEVFVACKKFI